MAIGRPPACLRLDRWQVLAVTFAAYSGLGIGDSFSLYSESVKRTFQLSQDDLDAIGMAGYWPSLVGAAIIPGLIGDKYGPGAAMLGAALFISAGLMLFWACLVGQLPIVPALGPVWQLSIIEAVRSFGFQWPSAAALPTSLKNFDRHKSVSIRVFAILKCLGSVGGGVASVTYIAFLAPDQSSFLLMAAVAVCALCVFAVPLMQDVPDGAAHAVADTSRLNHTFALLAILLPAIAAGGYLAHAGGLSREDGQAIALTLVFMWVVTSASPLWTGVRRKGPRNNISRDGGDMESLDGGATTNGNYCCGLERNPSAAQAIHSDGSLQKLDGGSVVGDVGGRRRGEGGAAKALQTEATPLMGGEEEEGGVGGIDKLRVRTLPDRNLWYVVRTLELWLILWICFSVFGTYAIFFLNLAQLCESLGNASASAFATTVLMVSAATGRLSTCLLYTQTHARGLNCTATFFMGTSLAFVSMLCFATGTMGGVYAGIFFGAAAYGGHWTLIPMVFGELWGLKHVAANYKTCAVAEAAGFLLLGRLLTSYIYEENIAVGGGKTCIGQDCFKTTFWVGTGLAASGILASVALYRRTRGRTY